VWTAPPTQVESLKDKQARVGRVQTCVRPRYAGLAGGPVWSSKVGSKTPGRARRHGRFTWFFRPRLTTVAPYLSSKTLPTPFPAFLRVGVVSRVFRKLISLAVLRCRSQAVVVSRVFRKLIWLAVLGCRSQAVRACSVLWLGGLMVR